MIKSVLVTFGGKRFRWESLNQILPAIESAWNTTNRRSLHRLVEVPVLGGAIEILKKASDADNLIFPAFNPTMIPIVKTLRESSKFKARLIFHTHGESTGAFYWFDEIRSLLTSADIFICASLAEARSVRVCYPNATIKVVPFAVKQGAVRKRMTHAKLKNGFVYVGRISEQKNLHVLICAYWLLRSHLGEACPKLHLYGAPDLLGSPNMGMRGKDYESYLKNLARTLDLYSAVQWHGFIPIEKILAESDNSQSVFVAPSLHSDEDFGIAARSFLLEGYRCVLSAWGGHLDFLRAFPKQTHRVPVYESESGPFIDVGRLCASMDKALSTKQNSHSFDDAKKYKLDQVGQSLFRLVSGRKDRFGPLRCSRVQHGVLRRRAKKPQGRRVPPVIHPSEYNAAQLKMAKVFSGYDDRLAWPFFRAYGMRKAAKTVMGENLVVLPWVLIKKKVVVVTDPHKGRRFIPIYKRAPTTIYDVKGREFEVGAKTVAALCKEGLLIDRVNHVDRIGQAGARKSRSSARKNRVLVEIL
jgi:glycosyltransferase involved in cell wall biosynthesis